MTKDIILTLLSPVSIPGALNLVSDQTHGATPTNISDNVANGSVIVHSESASSYDTIDWIHGYNPTRSSCRGSGGQGASCCAPV